MSDAASRDHALPNLFPALDAATEDALRESIKRFGVLVPVARDQHGRTLDGHHRARIADEVGAKYRVDVIRVESDDQAREIAVTLNTDRRQLDIGQRREIVAVLREQGHSLRAIAGAVGSSKDTVARDAAGVAVALVEYKHEPAQNAPLEHPTYRALRSLCERAGLPFMVVYYRVDPWRFLVLPVNDRAQALYRGPRSLSERRFVKSLYVLRERVVEAHVLARLDDTEDEVYSWPAMWAAAEALA